MRLILSVLARWTLIFKFSRVFGKLMIINEVVILFIFLFILISNFRLGCYNVSNNSLNQRILLRWGSHLLRMRLRKQPIHPWDYVPTLQRKQFKLALNLNPLVTIKHETHPSKLHLTAIVANHYLNPNSLLQAPMTPLPYGRHQEVYDPK